MVTVTYRYDQPGGLWPQASDQKDYRGLYINLDRSADRRTRMEEQLRRLNLADRYVRFPAIEASSLPQSPNMLSPGQQGCFHSHHRALELARDHGATVHVLEDDAVLSMHTEPAIAALQKKGAFSQFDIVLAETFVFPDVMALRQFKQWFDAAVATSPPNFSVQDFTPYFACTSASYVVAASAIDRVAAAFRRGIEAGPQLPFDLFIRQEAQHGRLRLGCIFPFISSVRLGEDARTTITDRDAGSAQLSRDIFDVLRYSFFIDRDLDGAAKPLREKLRAVARTLEADAHHQLIRDILGFVVSSDEFSMF